MCYDNAVTDKPHDMLKGVNQIYNIAELRKAKKPKGWSQEKLAEESGVHRIMIARYESTGANMTIETAKKLADALGCTIDELYGKTADG